MNRAFESDGSADNSQNTNISVNNRNVIADAELEIQLKVFWSCARKHVMKACVYVTVLYTADL